MTNNKPAAAAKRTAVIFDLDGTVSQDFWRQRFIHEKDGETCYDKYHELCGNDELIEPMARRVRAFKTMGILPIFVTGRPDTVRSFTEHWLIRELDLRPAGTRTAADYLLFMRDYAVKSKIGSDISTAAWKGELASILSKSYAIVSAYDDREDAVAAYRAAGIEAHQFETGADGDRDVLHIDPNCDVERIYTFDLGTKFINEDAADLRMLKTEAFPGPEPLPEPVAAPHEDAYTEAADAIEEGQEEAAAPAATVSENRVTLTPVHPTVETGFDALPECKQIIMLDIDAIFADTQPHRQMVPFVADAIRRGYYLVFVSSNPNEDAEFVISLINGHFAQFGNAQFTVATRKGKDEALSAEDFRIATMYSAIQMANASGARIRALIDTRAEVADAAIDVGILGYVSNGTCVWAPGSIAAMDATEAIATVLPARPASVEVDDDGEGFGTRTMEEHRRADLRRADEEKATAEAARNFGLSPQQVAIVRNLEGAAETFRDRARVYGQNDEATGKIMEILFPDGVALSTADDHRMWHFMNHLVGKLTRFAGSGMQDRDSIHDLITYAAFCERECEFHEIVTHVPN
ncbi:3'-phosphatase, 5'-polynucleotide kinase [Burkholderia phage vB_BglM_WTB]